MPTIETLYKETPSPLNPLGVKGVGEAGTIPAAAALISAVEDALTPFSVRIGQVPLTPMKIGRDDPLWPARLKWEVGVPSDATRYLIRGGRVYDHDGDVHQPAMADILISGETIERIAPSIPAATAPRSSMPKASSFCPAW